MKRFFALLLAVLLLSVSAFAEGTTSYELFSGWENNDSYPDYVTGVFYNTETGKLSFLLTENTAERQRELTAGLTDADGLTYYQGEYSHKELAKAQKELEAAGQEGVLAVRIGWSAVTGGFGAEGKDFRVVVTAADANAEALADFCREQWGDKVKVDKESAVKAAEEEKKEQTEPLPAEEKGLSNWAIIGIVAVCLVGLIFGLNQVGKARRR